MDFKVDSNGYVPGVKDTFMLGHPWQSPGDRVSKNSQDSRLMVSLDIPPAPLGWWMSEKFDGQRALWDGTKFISRGSGSGLPRVYPYVPQGIIDSMPKNVILDGEFYISQGTFQELGFLRGNKQTPEIDAKWKRVTYRVFDLISDKPWEERYSQLMELEVPSFVKITKQKLVKTQQQLDEFYNKILSKGGEGVILRAPKIPYIHRRTKLMYKLKPDHDAEAKVIGYKMGEGKYTGLLGALQLQTDKGITFYVSGFSDSVRKDYLTTHPIGTTVTYRYTFLTDSGVPRHPRYKGIPNDR